MSTEVDCHHEDYVHDIAFDFYGRRLATASADKKIKIWDKVFLQSLLTSFLW